MNEKHSDTDFKVGKSLQSYKKDPWIKINVGCQNIFDLLVRW